MMKKSAMLLVLLAVFIVSGCETMKGFGRDLEKLGGTIEDAASKDE